MGTTGRSTLGLNEVVPALRSRVTALTLAGLLDLVVPAPAPVPPPSDASAAPPSSDPSPQDRATTTLVDAPPVELSPSKPPAPLCWLLGADLRMFYPSSWPLLGGVAVTLHPRNLEALDRKRRTWST